MATESESNLKVNIETNAEEDGEPDTDHDPHYEPIISLPEVQVSTNEEDEIELIKIRAKLYRYDTSTDPPEWKERGTGDVKLLQHQTKNTVRVVMRRDKTLKICANHFVTPYMELKPNCGSDKAWVWSTLADFVDEVAQSEMLAIRFANAENAKKWKDMFEEAKNIVATKCDLYKDSPHNSSADDSQEEKADSSDEKELGKELEKLKLGEKAQKENTSHEETPEK
ncbi:ran-specific GTPase-activating protein-like [Macrosteles quadrilineatus]|uniref:ran-specific GTPase-activating protein-like n=1 Tax=Macrosteles quadrilineatus TaxID=74068 RepID=UPI0023E1B2E3|nr:ran-specific GTPase-activating protein-like [Macrosteles quadrilineatus]